MRKILFPEIEPLHSGYLQVSDIHTIHFEQAGNQKGYPAVFLHGGPGVGIIPDYRRFFDPAFYHIILPDQRGAGRSKPHAESQQNNTWELVEDLEKLRHHLGVGPWLVFGGSWGSTLALCYAIKFPHSIKGIIIRGVFLARPSELEWLHKKGASEIFPDRWERFIEIIPLFKRDDIVKGYYEILNGPDQKLALKAAISWAGWEASIMNLIPDAAAIGNMTADHAALSIGRIECHFTYHKFFLETDNFILENISKMTDIPVRIVQGRYDIICPMISAWQLHKALPKSELVIVPDGSHSPLDKTMASELVQATEIYKKYFK